MVEEEEGQERRTSWGCTSSQDTAARAVVCMEAQARPGLNMEQFHASAAEKSTGKHGANKETGSR